MIQRSFFRATQAKSPRGRTYRLSEGAYMISAALLSENGERLIRHSWEGPSGWVVQVADADNGNVMAMAGPTKRERDAKHEVHEQLRTKGYTLHRTAS